MQFGIIVFPICALQILTFSKAFTRIPYQVIGFGLYGGITAIFCTLVPVYVYGMPENFQSVPIILSILYGKRRAGLIAIAILIGQHLIAHTPYFGWSLAAIAVYSAIPLLICHRFERYRGKQRLAIASLLSLITLAVELAFVCVAVAMTLGSATLLESVNVLTVSAAVQLVVMGIAFLLLESIVENGAAHKRLQSLIEFSPIGIAEVDRDTRFVFANPAFESITGYSKAALYGRPWTVVANRKPPDEEMLMEHLQHGNVLRTVAFQVKHQDGHPVDVQFTTIPIMERGEVAGYYSLLVDMTEVKRAEAALIHSERLSVLGKMAVGIVHEVRNPLTAIQGFLELLPSARDPGPMVHIIQDEVTRINLLLSELLVLGKPQEVTFIPRDLRIKLQDVLRLLGTEAAEKQIQIRTQFDPKVPAVPCEPNQLKQVFINIIKNAIEATDPGGTIEVAVDRPKADIVRVLVKDSGVGIPRDILDRVGEPFFTTKESGTGLGLMTAKTIIGNHRGTLDIVSEAGHGTTVCIELPVLDSNSTEQTG